MSGHRWHRRTGLLCHTKSALVLCTAPQQAYDGTVILLGEVGTATRQPGTKVHAAVSAAVTWGNVEPRPKFWQRSSIPSNSRAM